MAAPDNVERKTDGVLRYLNQYLEARFDHASRINPSMRRVRDDLAWHELAAVRQILAEAKGFGPEKFVVVDILTSFDAGRKNALYSTTDQHTIFNEIVSEAESDKKQSNIEGASIRNIGDFYKAIDPSLERTVLLVQTWIWWDLPDAVDLHVLDLQADRVAALRRTEMSPGLLNFYRVDMGDANANLTIDDVVDFEVKRSAALAQAFEARRAAEPGHQMIIQRQAASNESVDSQILNLAQRLRVIEQVRKTNSVEPPLRDHYARIFQVGPETVTADRVVAYEQEICATVRQKIRAQMESDQPLGEPYDFKKKQIELVGQKMTRIQAAAAKA